jgi:hypothetical protein
MPTLPILKLIVIALICLCGQHTEAQTNRILTKDSTMLYVLIKYTTEDSIFFKYYGQHSDSISGMPLSNVHKIFKKNGSVDNSFANANDPKPKLKLDSVFAKMGFIPIYFDASVGFGKGAFKEYSVGIRLNRYNAIGISRMYWNALSSCCFTDADGIGVQWRFTPNKKIFTKLEVGHIKAAHYGDDGPYRAIYNYEKSNKIYQRLTVARSFSILTVGLTVVRGVGQVNDNFDYQTQKYLRSLTFRVNVIALSLGVALPPFYESRRKGLFKRF